MQPPKPLELRDLGGLSSGEGVIWAVRDPIKADKDPGEPDKRLLVHESELTSVLQVLSRPGNTLSPQLRNAWDGRDLYILTKNSPARATAPHISLNAHITRDELLRHLFKSEAGNGFANRFLWVMVRRSKLLPLGGDLRTEDLAPYREAIAEAVEFAREVGKMGFDDRAESRWIEVYPRLSSDKPGLFGAITARGEAQVRRLACLYALLDLSDTVCVEHLDAALALWDYCERSVRYIFGDALGDPVADTILKALRRNLGGLTRTDMIRDLFQGNKDSADIARALELLSRHELARSETDPSRGGRPAERWIATDGATT